MMQNSQDYSTLKLLCHLTHHACVSPMKFKHISDMALFEAWTACDMEHGITTKVIRDALLDKHINQKEFQQIHSEMFIDFARELELLDRLKHFSGLTESPKINKQSLDESIYATINNTNKAIPKIATAINMREIDLTKKTSPDSPNDILTVHETLALMLHTDNFSILHALAHQLNHICTIIPKHEGVNDMELLDAWSSWSDERSDTVSLIHHSLKDSTIESDELIQIEKEIYQDFHTELALLARLRLMIE